MPKKRKNDSQEINGMLNPSIKKNMYVDVKNHKNPEQKKLKIHQFLWSHHLVFSVFSSWLASKFMLTMSEGTLGAPDLGNLGMDETCGYGF